MKGRYAFDFVHSEERLQTPLRRVGDKFEEISWAQALELVAGKFKEAKAHGGKFGVIGSNHTTNEENYYLQKFAREGLGTENIDHHRTGERRDAARRAGRQGECARHRGRPLRGEGGAGCVERPGRSSTRCCPTRSAPITGIIRLTSMR